MVNISKDGQSCRTSFVEYQTIAREKNTKKYLVKQYDEYKNYKKKKAEGNSKNKCRQTFLCNDFQRIFSKDQWSVFQNFVF